MADSPAIPRKIPTLAVALALAAGVALASATAPRPSPVAVAAAADDGGTTVVAMSPAERDPYGTLSSAPFDPPAVLASSPPPALGDVPPFPPVRVALAREADALPRATVAPATPSLGIAVAVPLPPGRPSKAPQRVAAVGSRPAERPSRQPGPAVRPVVTAAAYEAPRRVPAAPVARSDGGGLLEALFGRAAPSPVLAYAPTAPVAIGPVATGGGTAVYDISARAVTLPDGSRLEAHSGLGAMADDPASVRAPMRGATPPGTYDLALRESPFHGVEALRLTPVSGQTYGRTGLLAHTYMLRGGRPESNGCVVFADYQAFLRAFKDGRVRRLVVVPGRQSPLRTALAS